MKRLSEVYDPILTTGVDSNAFKTISLDDDDVCGGNVVEADVTELDDALHRANFS